MSYWMKKRNVYPPVHEGEYLIRQMRELTAADIADMQRLVEETRKASEQFEKFATDLISRCRQRDT